MWTIIEVVRGLCYNSQMYKIENVKVVSCEESLFVKLERMHYKQDGIEKSWDIAQVHDSVAILIYHKEREAFVLVKQFRPPVYLKNGDGFSYELCAGIVDKQMSLVQIAQEEIEEETGFAIALERIEKITSFYTAVGFAGAKQTLYYVEVDDVDKVSEGGGIDVEQIEVIYVSTNEMRSFIYNEDIVKTPGLMFAMNWWQTDRKS